MVLVLDKDLMLSCVSGYFIGRVAAVTEGMDRGLPEFRGKVVTPNVCGCNS